MSTKIRRSGALIAISIAVTTVWIWSVFQPPASPDPISERFRLADVTIINPMVERLTGASLSVADGTLTLGTREINATEIDKFRGMYVLPGFVDMHSHMPPDNALRLTGHYGLLMIAHGVTTIRDAGDLDGTAVPAARRLSEQRLPFPNVTSCGPFVSNGISIWPNTLQLTTPEQAEEVASQISAGGHTCIKAYEGLTPEITAALIDSAKHKSLQLIGHVPVEYTIEQSGIIDVQHFFGVQPPLSLRGRTVRFRADDWGGVTDARIDNLVQYIVENEIRNTPTISLAKGILQYENYNDGAADMSNYLPALFADVIWHPEVGLPVYRSIGPMTLAMTRSALPQKLDLLKRLSDANAVLHIGTDTGQPFSPPGMSYWRELKIFESAGIDPEKVLEYATSAARRSLGMEKIYLAEGAPADLLIFAEDPTESLDNLETLQAIVVGGRLYEREQLQAAIDRSLDHYASWPLANIADWTARRTIATSLSGFD